MRSLASAIVAFAAGLMLAGAAAAQSCPAPSRLAFDVESRIERSSIGFTQGLERQNGRLLESTGPLAGPTRLNSIDDRGRVTTLANLGTTVFGEGLTVLGGRVYQLTWQNHHVFVYDLSGRRLRTLRNAREGWGLTNDGRQLIASDGSDRLWFIRPGDFGDVRSVVVRLGARPLRMLNELEWVDGRVWANVFGADAVVRIAPATGCVEAIADLGGLRATMTTAEQARLRASANEFVLNGIAYEPRTRRFYVTGKGWGTIFVGRFRSAPGAR